MLMRIDTDSISSVSYAEFDILVMAQVSCEVTAAKERRPNEGILLINVELSPMAAPHFEAGRRTDEALEVQRLLEHCLKDSQCVDTEALCITSGLRVWAVRVDVHVLNYDGNVTDAACLAAIAALSHFRRPDVSVCGEDVVIHSASERDPLPLSIIHIPISVSFAFFDAGKFMLVDPTQREQQVAEGMVIVAMNKHGEICMTETLGCLQLDVEQLMRCTDIAAVKVTEMTELIQTALDNDAAARRAGNASGLAALAPSSSVEVSDTQTVDMEAARQAAETVISAAADEDDTSSLVSHTDSITVSAILDSGVAVIGSGGASAWNVISAEMEDDIALIEAGDATRGERRRCQPQQSTAVTAESDSEEETVTVLDSKTRSARQIDLTRALTRKH